MNHAPISGGRSEPTSVEAPLSLRTRTDRGASLVEFAIILPLLCMLLFGVLEFGKGYNDYQALRQGVREAARGGAVDHYRSFHTALTPALAGCAVATDPVAAKKLSCLTKEEAGIGSSLRVRIRYTAPLASDPIDKGAVKVCAQRGFESITGFFPFTDNIILKTEIEMRMEKPIPAGIVAGTNYGDPAPSGGDWTWC